MRDRKKTAGFVGAGALAILMSTAAFAAPPSRNDNRAQSSQTYRVSDRNDQYGRAGDNRDYGSRQQAGSGNNDHAQSNQTYRVSDRGDQSGGASDNRDYGSRQQAGSGNNDHAQSNQTYRVSDRNDQYGRAGDNRGYSSRQQSVSGVVQRFDRRSAVLTIRDASSRRTVDIDTSGMRNGNFRRGEYVTITGQWLRGNVFSAYRIDGGNDRRD